MKHLIITTLLILFLPLSVQAEIIGTWKCGDNCTATLDDQGNFLVSGSGNMYSYSNETASNGAPTITKTPWGAYLSQIKNIEVTGMSNNGIRFII